MKRFYKEAAAGASPDPDRPGFVVLLDGRPVKTPRKATMAVDSASLAAAIAEEWATQAEEVAPLRNSRRCSPPLRQNQPPAHPSRPRHRA